MSRFHTWLSDNETEMETFRQEIEDQGYAVDVFRISYANGVLGIDVEVGDEAYLRTITVRVEEAKAQGKLGKIFGFTTDTDVRKGDHWRFRDRNDWEQFFKVEEMARYPYGTIAMLEYGK